MRKLKEEEAAAEEAPPAKKVKVEEEEMEMEEGNKKVQLCCRVIVHWYERTSIAMEISYLHGEAGKKGAGEVVNYIRCKNLPAQMDS